MSFDKQEFVLAPLALTEEKEKVIVRVAEEMERMKNKDVNLITYNKERNESTKDRMFKLHVNICNFNFTLFGLDLFYDVFRSKRYNFTDPF